MGDHWVVAMGAAAVARRKGLSDEVENFLLVMEPEIGYTSEVPFWGGLRGDA